MSNQTSDAAVPVLCLHGSLSSSRQWGALAKQLPESFSMIAPDLSGYGASPFPAAPDEYNLDYELDQLEARGLPDQFHLVGHSYGGAVATGLALRHPQKILSLTLFEPMTIWLLEQDHPGRIETNQILGQMNQKVEAGEYLQAARQFVDFWIHCKTSQALIPSLAKSLESSVKYPLDNFAASNHNATLQQVSALKMPVQLIGTPESPLLASSIIELLQGTLENVSVHKVNGGHLAPVTRPDLVNPLIIDFIQHH